MKRILLLLFVICFSGLGLKAQISSDSLLLYYPFNGNAVDESSHDYDATVYGAMHAKDRNLNDSSAFIFDGINDYILLPIDDELKPDFPFAISLWFIADELADVTSILYTSDEEIGVYSGFYIGYNPSGSISAGYGNGYGQGPSSRKTKHSNVTIDTDEWYHLIVSFNALNDIDIYLNCEEAFGYYSGSGNEMVDFGENGVIGRSYGHDFNNYHHGKIDDIRLYNRSMSADDITSLCMETLCSGSYTDTVTVFVVDTLTITNYISVTDTLIIDVNALNVDNVEVQNTIKVYPNPTNEFIYINTGDYSPMDNFSVIIINEIGSIVYQSLLNEQLFEVDLSSFGANGLYFIQIIDDNSNVIDTRKIVLQ